MAERTRKPGDQAPPWRPTHRNPGKTASTHVKDTSGLYRVHDGSPEKKTIVVPYEGTALTGLAYDLARKSKDYAVSVLKQKRATIERLPDATGTVLPAHAGFDVTKPAAVSNFGPQNPAPAKLSPRAGVAVGKARAIGDLTITRADPALEQARQAATAAAAGAAAAAQARSDALRAEMTFQPAAVPEVDVDGEDVSVEDLDALLGTGGDAEDEDAAAAIAQRDADIAQLEAAGRALYDKEVRSAMAEPWDLLPEATKADFRWRAANQ